MDNSVSIVIPYFEGDQYIDNCLNSILSNTTKVREIVIIDNGYSKLKLSKEHLGNPSIKIMRVNPAIGFGRACNIGLYYSLNKGDELTIILNQDAVMDKYCVAALIEAFNQDRSIFAIAPISYSYNFEKIYDSVYKSYVSSVIDYMDDLKRKTIKKVYPITYKQLNGACILFNNKLVERVGLFDPLFYMYGEETDLFRRVQLEYDYKIGFAPLAMIGHEHQNAIATGYKRKEIQFRIRRSVQIFLLKMPQQYGMIRFLNLLKFTMHTYLKKIWKLEFRELLKYLKSDLEFILIIKKILSHRNAANLKKAILAYMEKDMLILKKKSIN